MKIIVPAIDTFNNLSKNKENAGNTVYKPSSFCISTSCEDGTLIYHTLSGEMILFNPNENWEDNHDVLVRDWFMVPESFNDYSYAEQIRSISSLLNQKKYKTSFLILTTTDCNARCYYCYEMGSRKISMSEETAREVAAYLKHVSGDEELKLTWFGGEPMLNREAIDVICSELKKTGKQFKSTIISNGYYLDPETSKEAYIDWNLRSIQITIDGTKEVYQKTKAYIEHDNNAYERVIENIKGASDAGIFVRIRMNMDRNNAEDLFDLADELRVKLAGHERIMGQSALLQELSGKIGTFSSDEEAAHKCWQLQKKLDEQWSTSSKKLPHRILVNSCMADNDSCEIIYPNGNVGRCERLDQPNVVGNIYTDKRDEKQIKEWKERMTLPECLTCPLYPQCIKLKKCDWMKNGCSLSYRLLKRWEIEEKMLYEYKEYKERKGIQK